MTAFINGTGNISPQKTWDNIRFPEEIIGITANGLRCQEPADYEKFIDPKLLRRMSRLIRMSYTAARICLEDAGITVPDAIITGSGMGCLEDTEKFLSAIYQNDEKLLPPTPFIQSTHNTIGAQIALMLQCTNYNMTYSQRGISFENALTDAFMLLNEPEYKNVLVGGFDEMTDNQMILYNRLGYYKKEPVSGMNLIRSGTAGTVAGEGNTFFVLSSQQSENCYAILRDVMTISHSAGESFVKDGMMEFLQENRIPAKEIALCIGGFSGDVNSDLIYHKVFNDLFPDSAIAGFKHLCGEYHTASAFAVWLAAKILKHNEIPPAVLLKPAPVRTIKNILIWNHYRNQSHSMILLSACC
jgi:3-oxoacyl-(acyl-carrier-protein) synthase